MEILTHQVVLLLGFISFVQCAVTDQTTPKEIDCPIGFERIHRGCYKFVQEALDWDEALTTCKESNGELSEIISVRERDDVQKYLATHYQDIQSWWMGFKRAANTEWAWLGGMAVDPNMIPWSNPALRNMKRELCGTIEMKDSKLQISGTRCSMEKSFICEYHAITERATEATTSLPTEAPVVADSANQFPTSLEPVIPDPTIPDTPIPESPTPASFVPDYFPSQNTRDCNTDDTNVDYGRLVKRLSSVEDPLYQQYLQSEINANAAKITYYDKVARVYSAALERQNEWYASSQAKLQMEIDQLKRGATCP